MSHRSVVSNVGAVAALAMAALLSGGTAAAQTDPSDLMTSWGKPNLQGVWDFRTITPMQRPDDLAEKEFLTAEEAAERDRAAVEREVRLFNRPAQRTVGEPVWTAERKGRRARTTTSGWTEAPTRSTRYGRR